jgi:hypothetical protein
MMNEYTDQYIDQLETAYEKDTAELRNQLEEMTKDRDRWKDRCLEAETEKAQAQRQLRHV